MAETEDGVCNLGTSALATAELNADQPSTSTAAPSLEVMAETEDGVRNLGTSALAPAELNADQPSTSRLPRLSLEQEIGKYCSEAGLMLQHFAEPGKELPRLNSVNIGVVVELHAYLVGTLGYSLGDLSSVILRLVGRDDVKVKSTATSISRLVDTYKKKKKNKATKLQALSEFMDEPYKIVRKREETYADTPRKKKMRKELNQHKSELKHTKKCLAAATEFVASVSDQLATETSQRLNVQEKHQEAEQKNKILQEQNHKLEEEIADLQSSVEKLNVDRARILEDLEEMTLKFDPLSDELLEYTKNYDAATAKLRSFQNEYDLMKAKLQKYDTRNVNRRMIRREKKITHLQLQKEQSEQQSHKLLTTVTELQEELEETKANLTATQNAVSDLKCSLIAKTKDKKRVSKQLQYSKSTKADKYLDKAVYEKELNYLQSRVLSLQKKNNELEDLVGLLQDEEVSAFHNGRYSDDVRETIMELLACNVSMAKVGEVMKVVLSKLGKQTISKVPSIATISQIAVEARHLADLEVAQAMHSNSLSSALGNCLHGDGTTKYHKKYQNLQVSLPDGSSRTVGLTQMAKGNVDSTLDAFKERLQELAHTLAISDVDKDEQVIYNELLCSIKSTMSDQGPGMPQFSEKVECLRKELLPSVVENWESMPEDVKEQVSAFGRFYCKMHPIINFAEEINKVLKSFEEITVSGKNPHTLTTSEAGVTRLVRTASKAFNHRGSDQSGVEDAFTSFLDNESQVKNHIVNFIGNRTNILFEGAAAVYYHNTHITNFIAYLPDPNRLLLAVKEDILEPIHLAELRALGIIHASITEPLWRAIQGADNILSTNGLLHKLQVKLKEWKDDATLLLHGDSLSEATEHHAVHEKLFEETDADLEAMCTQALEIASCAMLLILERQCQDQLPGGKYWDMGELESSFSNVPATNVISERDFAQLDLLVRVKPAARTLTHETLIMWVNNKTPAWLNELTPETKAKYMGQARAHSGHILERYKKRMKRIKADRWALLQEKQKKKNDKDDRQRSQTIALVNEINILGGVWTSITMAEEKYQSLLDQGHVVARKGLYSQLQFMNKVLKCKAPGKEYFQLSSQQVQYTHDQLFAHVKGVINMNDMTGDIPEEACTTSGLNYTSEQTRSNKFEELKRKIDNRIVNDSHKRAAVASKKYLDALLADPGLLVGKRVDHLFRVDKTDKWYSGMVVRIEKEHDDKQKTSYVIDYDLESELEIYPLLHDLGKGELVVHDM